MSMPNITLAEIDPRTALASIVASIALQEAAVSHVLNAEGEKIQAVVGMTGTTLEELQEINRSVGETVNNVALFEDDLRSKLQTTLEVLYPTATFPVQFINALTGLPADCNCVVSTLTNYTTGEATTLHARGSSLRLANLKPGSYALHMEDACPGFAPNENWFYIDVDDRGHATFNGEAVTGEHPAEIELNTV